MLPKLELKFPFNKLPLLIFNSGAKMKNKGSKFLVSISKEKLLAFLLSFGLSETKLRDGTRIDNSSKRSFKTVS